MQNIDPKRSDDLCRTCSNRAVKDILNICLHYNEAIQHSLNPQSEYRQSYTPTAEQLQRVIHFFVVGADIHPKTKFVFATTPDIHLLATTIRDAMKSVATDVLFADNKIALKKREAVIRQSFKNITDTPMWEPRGGWFAPTQTVDLSGLKTMVKKFTRRTLKDIDVPPPRAKYVDPAAIRAHREALREKKRQEELKNMEHDIRKNFGI